MDHIRTEIIEALRGQLDRALIALDFDGTLAPIVKDPTSSRPVDGTIEVLTRLADRGAQVAVITGRDARTAVDLGGLDAVPGIVVAGLYGAETWHDGELDSPDQPPEIDTLRAELPAVIATVDDDIWIEDKRLSLVVHARRAARPAESLDAVRPDVEALAARLGLETHDGKDVLEIRLPGYDKGGALRRLVERFAPTAVLFAGDDVGDVPAFEAIRALRADGLRAYGVAVAGATENVEAVAAADLRVDDPHAFVALLRSLATVRQ